MPRQYRIQSRMKLRAVLFDAYGTLFDVHSVALLAEQLFPGQGRKAVAAVARQADRVHAPGVDERQPRQGGAHYRPFWDLTRAGLRYAAARLGLALDLPPKSG
jgi:2-haloacid dehalogenase